MTSALGSKGWTFMLGAPVVVAVVAAGCRPARTPQEVARRDAKARARHALCSDIGEKACLAQCPARGSAEEHADCLLRLRFDADPEALRLARSLRRADVLVGVAGRSTIEGYKGQQVELVPALPLGDERHHLAWLRASLASFDGFVDAIAARAQKPVTFTTHPKAFLFFRTRQPSYPSAFFENDAIAYNLDGPLHGSAKSVRETLFHELFHLNDHRPTLWSIGTLSATFEAIVEKCEGDHACFARYSPFDTVVPDGTYYPFDRRTRDVREYGAELALRYFLEHEVILAGGPPRLPPFKCLAEENRAVWEALADSFFGGVDLSPPCDTPEVLEAMGPDAPEDRTIDPTDLPGDLPGEEPDEDESTEG